ncbi:MAG: porin [Hyphomicrobiales bacterium]|nr:porin [Hyphomicrobiales bacterium]
MTRTFAIVSLTATFVGLGFGSTQIARAEDASSQNSMFLPSGKSQAAQALEAKKTARCVALYGPGYAAIADTDTCIRIGGKVGVEIGTTTTKHNRLILPPSPSQGIGAPAPALGGAPVAVVRQPKTGSATSADVYVDTHTPTELGDFSTHVSVGGVRATGALVGPDYVR